MKSFDGTSSRADRLAGLFTPAIVDIFAGCGGWSIGEEQAFIDGGYRDKYIDLMINHWEVAVGVHSLNHPLTQHLRANILEVDPNQVLLGRPILHLHASPDCTDHSKAKGGKPRRKEIRALADVVIVWAGKRRPSVITLENVEEFQQWGPLLDDGHPDPGRRGDEFRRWIRELQALGYAVDYRELRACDYGVPTTRKRLFVIARCDGRPIVWPEATHGKKRPLKQYETAASCIDWSIPMLSIFATPAEAKAWSQSQNAGRLKPEKIGTPRRPLKQKTLERIARGLVKFVLNAKRPFIVDIQNFGWNSTVVRDVDQPMPTVSAGPKGGGLAAVDAKLTPYTFPNLGEREGQAPRCGSVSDPMPTVTAKGNGARLVAATLQTLNHAGPESRAQSPCDPLQTVTGARDARALVSAMITKHYSGVIGNAADQPLDTVTATDHNSLTVAYLNKHRSGSIGTAADMPIDTITAGAGAARDAGAAHAMGVTCAYLSQMYGTNKGTNGDPKEPAAAVTGLGKHAALVAAFLATYYTEGSGKTGQPIDYPSPTVTGKDRIQLVTVIIDGQTYVVTDIAMRMLTPRELARAQGFPDHYVIDRTADGRRLGKADQVKLIGNSVCPAVARAIVKANIVDQGLLDDVPVMAGVAS